MICDKEPEAIKKWHEESNYVVVVSVPDEDELLDLADVAFYKDVPVHVFCEPDIGDEHTALAMAPGPEAASICGSLPLAMREVSV
jgi:peptidyl-tRNA hydrolase